MRQWLTARKAGIEVVPNPDDPTSVLRPSRATTVGEKLEMKKRKQMNKVQTEGQKKIKKDIVDLQQQAAAEGCVLGWSACAPTTLLCPAGTHGVRTTGASPILLELC